MQKLYQNVESLVLASKSPRRHQFLNDAGLSFIVSSADIDETTAANELPDKYVIRMATEKAQFVSSNFRREWVVAADTIVVDGKKILGKPRDQEDAVSMLMSLSGKVHQVKTAFVLMKKELTYGQLVTTEVSFISFTEDLIRSYVNTEEPMDKAGSYGIQGLGGFLVKGINGSYSNVVGLPMAELLEALIQNNVIALYSV